MTDLLLDTHVWIWVSVEDRQALSQKAGKMIRQAGRKWISAISCWELAKLVEKERIGFSIPVLTWIRRSLHEYDIEVTDLSPEIVVESIHLKGFHKDPADQIIVATSSHPIEESWISAGWTPSGKGGAKRININTNMTSHVRDRQTIPSRNELRPAGHVGPLSGLGEPTRCLQGL